MKIAIITSGILPVPAVQGGAVENLIDTYLEYNETHKLHDITVFSAYHPDVHSHKSLQAQSNHYEYINIKSWLFKLGKKLYALFPHNDIYLENLEFFLEMVYWKMRGCQYDAIVLENRPGFAVKMKQRFPKTTIISHMHTNMLYSYSKKAERILNSTDAFIAVSDYIKNQIASIGLPATITTVHNGLDTSLFDISATPIARTMFGFNKNDFVVVFCGRLIPAKGVKELLLAFQALNDAPDIKMLIIGGENFADTTSEGTFVKEIHTMAEAQKDRIVFTGFVPYHLLSSYISCADVMVVPSHINEAFGMVCLEACSMGLPVIATDDGGIPEALVGQKHILIDKSKNLPQQIANAILEIRKNHSSYQGNHLLPQFTKEAYAHNFFNTLSEINRYG